MDADGINAETDPSAELVVRARERQMLSGLVYAAVGQVSNRFKLCASVSLATRKLHVASTPVGTTIGRVLNTMASGKYEVGPTVLFDSTEIEQAACHRADVRDEQLDIMAWGLKMHPNMPLGDMHRILAGMR
jgi:hypothetical protein